MAEQAKTSLSGQVAKGLYVSKTAMATPELILDRA